MADGFIFETRGDFRKWLGENPVHDGVWLIFSKVKAIKTLTAAQALEEALCFGWIDGQMESIDEKTYRKYFSPRREKSKWSEKNRKLAEKLEKDGLMTQRGRAAIEAAKKAGLFEGPERAKITDEQVEILIAALAPYEKALMNFMAMTPSVRRTYTGAYLSVKTDAGRERKLLQLVERLEMNLNPMESLAKKKAGQ